MAYSLLALSEEACTEQLSNLSISSDERTSDSTAIRLETSSAPKNPTSSELEASSWRVDRFNARMDQCMRDGQFCEYLSYMASHPSSGHARAYNVPRSPQTGAPVPDEDLSRRLGVLHSLCQESGDFDSRRSAMLDYYVERRLRAAPLSRWIDERFVAMERQEGTGEDPRRTMDQVLRSAKLGEYLNFLVHHVLCQLKPDVDEAKELADEVFKERELCDRLAALGSLGRDGSWFESLLLYYLRREWSLDPEAYYNLMMEEVDMWFEEPFGTVR